MKKKHWPARDPVKNYFPLPNELYSLGLSSTAIAIYGYMLRIEDRQTYQCLASYSKIGKAIGRSVNTVRKYVSELSASPRQGHSRYEAHQRPHLVQGSDGLPEDGVVHGDASSAQNLCRLIKERGLQMITN